MGRGVFSCGLPCGVPSESGNDRESPNGEGRIQIARLFRMRMAVRYDGRVSGSPSCEKGGNGEKAKDAFHEWARVLGETMGIVN